VPCAALRDVDPHDANVAQVERDGERLITTAWRAHTVFVRTIAVCVSRSTLLIDPAAASI
jgi:hypothetical protein